MPRIEPRLPWRRACSLFIDSASSRHRADLTHQADVGLDDRRAFGESVVTQTHVIAAAAILLCVSPATRAQAQTPRDSESEPIARVVQLLEESGYRYTKETAWLWSVPFKATHVPSVSVWLMTSDDELIVESVIARHDRAGRLPEALRQRLAQSGSRDGLAFMVDEDGNYVARSRLMLDALEAPDFQASVQKIVAATDAALGAIKGLAAAETMPRTVAVTGTFAVPAGATSHLDLLRGRASVSFNPARWKETRSAEAGKRTFQHTDGGGFAMVVAERIATPAAQLRDRALANMRLTASDIQVVDEQRRHVNGTDLLSLQINVTVEGVPFTYLGYYYAGPSGTVQVVTYTERDNFSDYQRQFEEFLNGFRVAR
jgi:hypothetical protein